MSDEKGIKDGGDGHMLASILGGTLSNSTEEEGFNITTTPFPTSNSTNVASTPTTISSITTSENDTFSSTLSQLFTTSTIGSTISLESFTSTTTAETFTTSYFFPTNSTTPTPNFTDMPLFSTSTTPPTGVIDYCVPTPEWTTTQMVLTLVPTISLMLLMIIGNLLVILAILTQKNLRTPSNMYILSLAVTDLTVGLFILPFNVYEMLNISWELGNVFCRIWLTADVTLCSSSILHIAAIAVDRFRSINEGLSYAQTRTIRSTLVLCGALWFLSLWIASPPVLGWNDWKDQVDTDVCAPTRKLGYIVHSATGAFFIPAIVMVGVYIRIYFLLRRKFREKAEMKCMTTDHNHGGKTTTNTSTTTHSKSDDLDFEQSSGIHSGEVIEEKGESGGDMQKSGKIMMLTNFFKRHNYSMRKNQDHGTTTTTATSVSEDWSEDHENANDESGKTEAELDIQGKTLANPSSIKKSTLQRFLARNAIQESRKTSEQITAIMKKKTKFSLNKERKAAKTLGILMFCFLVSWTPFTITYLLSGILPKCYINMTFFQIVTWNGYVNSAVNPIIYNMYSVEFKKAFKKLVVWGH